MKGSKLLCKAMLMGFRESVPGSSGIAGLQATLQPS